MNKIDELIATIPNFWNEERCVSFIAMAEERGIVPAITDYPPHYRNNDRQVLDDEGLANAVFKAVAQHLPLNLVDDRGRQWKPIGINSRFRLCRYRSGQFFARHRDGVFHPGPNQKTMLSLLIYLNGPDNFMGGRTRFFSTQNETHSTCTIVPQSGMLVFFPHDLWHDGESIDQGEKYVLRSDVVFECEDNSFADSGTRHDGYVWQALALDNKRFITGGRDKRIVLWEFDHNGLPSLKKDISPQQQSVTCLVKLNQNVVVAGSRDRSLALIDVGTFVARRLPEVHAATITQLAPISEELFASACAGGVIAIRDLEGKPIHMWQAHKLWIWGLVTYKDKLVSVAEDGALAAWDKSAGALLTRHQFLNRTPSALAQDQEGNLAVGFLDGGIEVGRFVQGWECIASWQAHAGAVRAIVSVSGAWLSGGEDCSVRRKEIPSHDLKCLFVGRDFVRNIVAINNQIIIVGYDGTVSRTFY